MIRYKRAFGRTKEEMFFNLLTYSNLAQEGDCVLVWINTNDLNNLGEEHGELDLKDEQENRK